MRSFCDDVIAPKAAQRDEESKFEDGLRAKLAEMGLFGAYVPSEYGGAGLDIVSYVMIVEELSRACGSTGILVSAHHSLCVDPILTFGNEHQKRRCLPPLSPGEKIGVFPLSGPGRGGAAGGGVAAAPGRCVPGAPAQAGRVSRWLRLLRARVRIRARRLGLAVWTGARAEPRRRRGRHCPGGERGRADALPRAAVLFGRA